MPKARLRVKYTAPVGILRGFSALILAVLACLSLFVRRINAENVDGLENVGAVCVYNVENDLVLFTKDADKPLPMGAMARLMTGLIACETLGDKLNTKFTVTEQMIYSGASKLGIKLGETMPLADIVYGLVCSGYDDCAKAIAVYISGSVDNFVSDRKSVV